MASKKTPPKQQDPKLSTAKPATQGMQNNRTNGELKTDPEHGRQLMSPVKQATLLNYHLAIEDSVDPEKIWESMQQIFSDQEQQEIRVSVDVFSLFLSSCLSMYLYIHLPTNLLNFS